MNDRRQFRLIPAVVGPTCSGKSDLGIRLALKYNGEIINLDSVQVYREINIATAKVPEHERRGVPHHLIDIADPVDNFTAGDYARLAAETIADIELRNRTAILVGGTGFYLRALIRPLFSGPQTNQQLRSRLKELHHRFGAEHLHRMLERVDPQAALKLERKDWPRTMRAIEVFFQTGRRISESQSDLPPAPEFASRLRVIALNPPRDELYAQINKRAEVMFERGLVEEVESLVASGIPYEAKAFQAHGYKRVVEHLLGTRSREDALDQMKLDTRHYAKRQLSWWRSWPEVKWVDSFGDREEAFNEAIRFLEYEDWDTRRGEPGS